MNPHYIKLKLGLSKTFIYIILTLGALSIVIPYIWMVVTSIKPIEDVQAYPPSFYVRHPTFQPYRELFFLFPMARYLLNSIFVAGTVTLCNVFLCSLAGYAFAKHNFLGRDKIFYLFLITLMVPYQVNLIPSFLIIKHLNWLNTFYALIIPNLAMVFGVFLCRQYIVGIPQDLLEMAKLDGCSEFMIYRYVILPLMRPALITLALFVFLSQWNSFVWPLVVIHTSSMRTVPLALSVLSSSFGANSAMVMAGATVGTIPVLIIFIYLQKYFTRAVVMIGLR